MKPINTATDLREAILQLEFEQTKEGEMLKEQLHSTFESMKPLNLIKSSLKEVSASQDLQDNLINATVGITAGFISKKLFEGVSNSPLRKLLGTALMFGISNVVAKNPEIVKATLKGIVKFASELKPKHIEHSS